MASLAPSIEVANDNSLINYNPNVNAWSDTPKTNAIFQIGDMGAPLSSSLKSINNGSISFSFEGLSVSVMVSYIPADDLDPSVACQLDSNIMTGAIPPSSQNNWPLCSFKNLQDGEHKLTVDISDPLARSLIFFDYLLYALTSNRTQVNATVESTRTRVSLQTQSAVQNFSNIAPGPTPNTTPLGVFSSSAGSRSNRDMIIGITFGVGIFLLIIILFLFRRWKKRSSKERKKRFDISSNRERSMRTISMVMPNPFNVHDSGQSRNNLLTQHCGRVCATETSTEVLFNSYAITPFQTPSLPVAYFDQEEKLSTHNDPQPLPLAVHDSHLLNDAENSNINQRTRPLSNLFIQTGSTRAAAEVLETSTAPFSRLSFTALPEQRHEDSGVRLARDILLYDETNSEWSLRSKDRLPPPYSHN